MHYYLQFVSEGYPTVFPPAKEPICCLENARIMLFCGFNCLLKHVKITRRKSVSSHSPIGSHSIEIQGLDCFYHSRSNRGQVSGADKLDPLEIVEILQAEASFQLSNIACLLRCEGYSLVSSEISNALQAGNPLFVTGCTSPNYARQCYSGVQFNVHMLSLCADHCSNCEKGGDSRNPSARCRDPISETLLIVCACAHGLPGVWLPKNHDQEDRDQHKRAKPRHKSVRWSKIHNKALNPRQQLTRPAGANQWGCSA